MGREGLRPQAEGGCKSAPRTAPAKYRVLPWVSPLAGPQGPQGSFKNLGISIQPVPPLLKGGVNLWSVPQCPQGLPPLGSC